MPRTQEIRTNFTAGELSEDVDTRVQFNRYFSGSSIIENFTILTQGGMVRRKGSKFLAEVKDSSKITRLISFRFSAAQSYIMEFGEGYIRFFRDEARVLDAPFNIIDITNSDPAVVTTDVPHGYNTNDVVVIKDVLGMTEVNDREFIVGGTTPTAFQLQGIDSTSFGLYISGGTVEKAHEITNPYAEDELFDLKFVQTNDIMYFVHPNHQVHKLTRQTPTSFTFVAVDLIGGPYRKENTITVDDLTISGGPPWTEGSALTLTATGGHTPFDPGHVGSLWKVRSNTTEVELRVTAFISSTVVDVIALDDIPGALRNNAISTWSEGEFSDFRGYPASIAFHEQRLVLAGNRGNPNKIWFSKTNGDYENFEAGTLADDAFSIVVAANEGDRIRWLFSDDVLFIGTEAGIWKAENTNNNKILSPVDLPNVKKQVSYGSSTNQPQLADRLPIYIQRGRRRLRGISYSLDNNKFAAGDLTVDANHILSDGIVEMEYQQSPVANSWFVRQDGEIAVMTIESDQEVLAWHRVKTRGKFESCAIVPDTADDFDEIYYIVNRLVDGDNKRYIEAQKTNYLNDDLNATYVDSHLTYNGTKNTTLTLTFSPDKITSDAPVFVSSDVGKQIHQISGGTGKAEITNFVSDTEVDVDIIETFSDNTILPGTWAIAVNVVTGLNHLIGEIVSVRSDNATEPDKTVDEFGQIITDSFGSIIHVGLGYESRQKNMPLEATSLIRAIGTSHGKDKRIDSCVIKFGVFAGGYLVIPDKLIPLPARATNDNMGEAPPLFSGFIEQTVASSWDKEGFLEILQKDPQPMYVKSILYRVTVNSK